MRGVGLRLTAGIFDTPAYSALAGAREECYTHAGNGMQYSKLYYKADVVASMDSARVIVPIVVDLLHPKSVIDFGCGMGTWLSVFKENGVGDMLGIDGHWVRPGALFIDPECFVAADLTQPIDPPRRFDLAMSLEVAEHLPSDRAGTFVESIIRAAPAVLFSAAIPFQGGLRHFNEQWPAYWAQLFRERGYRCIDCIRERIWNDPRVTYWYAQNTLLFVDEHSLPEYPSLAEMERRTSEPLPLVHPEAYTGLAKYKLLNLHHLFYIWRKVRGARQSRKA